MSVPFCPKCGDYQCVAKHTKAPFGEVWVCKICKIEVPEEKPESLLAPKLAEAPPWAPPPVSEPQEINLEEAFERLINEGGNDGS